MRNTKPKLVRTNKHIVVNKTTTNVLKKYIMYFFKVFNGVYYPLVREIKPQLQVQNMASIPLFLIYWVAVITHPLLLFGTWGWGWGRTHLRAWCNRWRTSWSRPIVCTELLFTTSPTIAWSGIALLVSSSNKRATHSSPVRLSP